MKRIGVIVFLLAACDRRGPPHGDWDVARLDAAGSPSAADNGQSPATGPIADAAPRATDATPPPGAAFAGLDAGADRAPDRAEPPAPRGDAGPDGSGDARACGDAGACD
jgi:hypothetical protein